MTLFAPAPQPSRQSMRLCAFGLTYCLLHVGTEFLTVTFPNGLTLGDWVSLLCPWLVMGSAWLVWDRTAEREGGHWEMAALLLSALLYATGYGINLSANAVGHLVDELAQTQPSRLIYFLDEHLGHVLWHAGMVGTTVSALIVAVLARPVPAGRPLGHRFFLVAHALALVQFAVWAAWQGGFPEFSRVWHI